MKISFKDLNGKPYRQSISHRVLSKSGRQDKWGCKLRTLFEGELIWQEFYVRCIKCYLDFFLPHRNLVVEVDGRQHKEYVPFFHGTRRNFERRKMLDRQKADWCEINGLMLLRITDQNEEAAARFLTQLRYGGNGCNSKNGSRD